MGVNADVYAYIPRDLFAFALYGTPDANGVNRFDLSTFGVDASLYSKIGLGYMYQINEHWQIGLKAKFLMGYANINTSIDQLELNASRQSWSLHTDGRINASLPINYNTTEDGNIDFKSVSLHDKNQLLSLLYQPAGYGAAIDLLFILFRCLLCFFNGSLLRGSYSLLHLVTEGTVVTHSTGV